MSFTQRIIEALEAKKVTVEPIADSLNLKLGRGLRAKKANIDVQPFVASLPNRDDIETHLKAYIEGVYRALEEPTNHRSKTWSYEQSAGLMMPELQHITFAEGFEAVNSTPPWFQQLDDTIMLTTAMVIDQGIKTVSKAQVDQWGATDDRMYSAARSMLFHKTRDYTDDIKNQDHVYSMRVGDGFDASRCMVIADILFTELNEFTMAFGLPHQDILYYVTERQDDKLSALRQATQQAYDDAKYPLSTHLYKLEKGRPARL